MENVQGNNENKEVLSEEINEVEVAKREKQQKLGFNYEVSGEGIQYSDFKDKVNELIKIVGKNSTSNVNFSLNISSSDE